MTDNYKLSSTVYLCDNSEHKLWPLCHVCGREQLFMQSEWAISRVEQRKSPDSSWLVGRREDTRKSGALWFCCQNVFPWISLWSVLPGEHILVSYSRTPPTHTASVSNDAFKDHCPFYQKSATMQRRKRVVAKQHQSHNVKNMTHESVNACWTICLMKSVGWLFRCVEFCRLSYFWGKRDSCLFLWPK